ncbi:MAG: calcium-binding protein, partial [Sulfuricurvum sp.]|nr:calcium-binding protein [Sulfuricurvum sp.]MDD5084398.1 calcium-binding protein [Candidatus Moranbacteria bacterium]
MRNLTPGEINMLRDVFGDSINYNEVMIHPTGLPAPGVTLFGDVYINSGTAFNPESNQYQSDFSKANADDQALFFHEMTHVWQSQNGYPTGPIGFDLQGIYKTGVVNPYDYTIDSDSNKSFKDYNMEQQAKLIEDYKKSLLKPDAYTQAQKDALRGLVGDFINSDKGKEWLPTKESLHDILRKFREGLLHKISDPVNDLWHAFKNWVAPRRDPLVLDLDGDGIETLGVNATTHVVFDYDGDGVKTGTGWIKGDDGFVVLDRNGNGTIDNGGELFGDQTLVNAVKATDGFAALSAEDTNHNGKFDAGDTNFTNVRIWQDTNSDGISQAGELHTLSELGITSINLTSTTSNTVSNGNVQIAAGTYTKTNGDTGESATLNLTEDTGDAGNLNFSQNPFYSEFTDHLTLTDTALALPDMHGSGMVRDLREASTLSAGLTSTLQTMSTTYETHDQMMAQIDTLLGQWAGTSSMATSVQMAEANRNGLIYLPSQSAADIDLYFRMTNSGGSSIASATDLQRYQYLESEQTRISEMIGVLEEFNGEHFVTVEPNSIQAGSGTVTSIRSDATYTSLFVGLSAAQVSFIEQSYATLKQSVYDGLTMQTRLSSYLNAVKLTVADNGIAIDMGDMIHLLDERKNTNIINAIIDCIELNKYINNKLILIDAHAMDLLNNWFIGLDDDVIGITKSEQQLINTIIGSSYQIGMDIDDVLTTGVRDDIVLGLSGNDVISAGYGDDIVYGGLGDDVLYGNSGADFLDGGDGNDTIIADDESNNGNTPYSDTLIGGKGNDTLQGGAGDDMYVFNIGDGADTIYDYDALIAYGIDNGRYNAGNDTIQFGEGISASDIRFYASGNNLIIQYSNSDQITVKDWYLANNTIENIKLFDGTTVAVSSITAVMSEGADVFNNTSGHQYTVDGQAGNDTITTGSGADTINGGDGNDTIASGSEVDMLDGGEGNDVISAGYGDDIVYGGLGDDVLYGNSGADFLDGGDGNDTII